MNELEDSPVVEVYLSEDENGRTINIHKLERCRLVGSNILYPNCLLLSGGDVFRPMKERVMSLENVPQFANEITVGSEACATMKIPVFFFIYNTDNYYHFIYDTLPYLITYMYLKKNIPELKLLMNYPNQNKSSLYPFVLEFLEILGVHKDIVMADENTMYERIYMSSSYTHGHDSNLPPRKEIYYLYNTIVDKVVDASKASNSYPEKIYVSRRSWMHKDLSNIGTNYTTKRSLCNENELVSYLLKKDYSQVFAEQLSTVDKINMFHRAKHVVGAIGGGICNVLFSPFNTRLIALISPTFLDVNERFLYSFSRVKTHLFMDTHHHELANWKKYMRVRTISGITGEIEEILSDGTINVLFCDGNVSGWNSQMELKRMNVPTSECTKMDEGLNSAWSIDMSSFKRYIDAIT